MPIDVTLTWSEVVTAAFVGCQRRVLALKKGRAAAHGYQDDNRAFDQDIEAACAEMAVAKGLCIYWPTVFGRLDTEDGDVGFGGIQVRSTKRPNGCLIIHQSDPPEHVFVLVTGTLPSFSIHGWIRANQAMRSDYWREDTGRPAYFVPQHALLPLEEMK